MTTCTLEGTLLRASDDGRIRTYLLAPFGEAGRTNLGRVTLTASSLTIPDDVTALPVSHEHDRTRPVAKFARIQPTDAGYEADVRFLETTAGTDALTEADEGVRRGISVEVDKPVIRNGSMLSGTLTGAAVCVAPAYPSALLVAADAGELPDTIDINGATYVRQDDPPTTEDAPSPDDAAQAAESETPMSATLTASAAAAAGAVPVVTGNPPAGGPRTVGQFARMLASAYRSGGDSQMFAALADIVHDDGDNDGDGLGEITAPHGWLGNVWADTLYERIYIPLLAGGTLTSWRETGFRWSTKPVVAPYAGNKAPVPSTGMSATPVNFGTERWANAADIDRRYVDFGDSDVIAAFIEANVDSYKEVTDLDVAQFIADIAGAGAAFTPEAGVNPALQAIVEGALALLADGFKPSFSIIGLDVYKPLLYLKKDDVSAFLTESYGLQGGLLEGIKLVPSAEPAYVGNVVVGDGRTARFKEMSGTPVKVEAENIANGGRDIGVFGYTSNQLLKPGGVLKYDITATDLAADAPTGRKSSAKS